MDEHMPAADATTPQSDGPHQPGEADTLDDRHVDPDPIAQFRRWLDDAVRHDVPEPNAMVLATASPQGRPSARTVLLKGLDADGFVFYTNYDSDKARDLDANPRAELVFCWHRLQRQVRIAGTVARVDSQTSAAYFATRSRESQLGAWASRQSAVVPDRETLDAEYATVQARWSEEATIPVPPFWGGYRLAAHTVELWQGRVGRLHDRLRYRRAADTNTWSLERLAP